MADYKGNTCPVCKQKFKEADDIVVCPDCGTPYHRECWKKVGVCVHQADHAAGFEWTPDNVISDRPDDIVCPNCGTHNPLGAKYCNHCGVSLPDHPDHALYQKYFPNGGASIFTFNIKGGREEAFTFIDNLKIFSLLANVADVKSLVIHPASTTHSQLTDAELAEQQIYQNTIRLSIGTEHIDDILADLEAGFAAVRGK